VVRPETLRQRSRAFTAIRAFFLDRGFVEVDAPLLLPGVPLEATIAPFEVRLATQRGFQTRYLPTSPEAGLKQALAILGEPLFELGWAFRDGEEEGDWHRAAFRMLEWYRPNATWRVLLDDTRDLFRCVASTLGSSMVLSMEWEEITVQEAVEQYTDVSLRGPDDLRRLPDVIHARHMGTAETWQDALSLLLALEVHPHLGWERPTFLTAYPAGIASMARVLDDAPWLAEQFEVFIRGVELANCYGEVTDPEEQRRRFAEESLRAPGRPPVDPAWLDALARLPARCAGGSVGVDRLLMVLLGIPSIGDARVG